VSANLTGATRLLLTGATAMPVVGAWLLRRRGQAAQVFTLPAARRVDLAALFVAAGYGILIALLGRISLVDGAILLALYVFYLRRIRGTPDEPPAVVGVSAALAALPSRKRRWLLLGLFALSAVVVAVVATPFAEVLQKTGTSLGANPYLLVQSIAPGATEMPEFVVAIVLALNRRPAQAVAVFLAASVVQWTLAIGILPWAHLAGGGGSVLPLNTRASVELALSVSTTLMAIAALTSLARTRIDAGIVLTLFAIQLLFPAPGVRLAVAVVLALFATDILVANHRGVRRMLAALRSRPPRPTPPT
jgi:cation:H+ antiporter